MHEPRVFMALLRAAANRIGHHPKYSLGWMLGVVEWNDMLWQGYEHLLDYEQEIVELMVLLHCGPDLRLEVYDAERYFIDSPDFDMNQILKELK